MRMSTGIHRSRAPTESKPRNPARCPSWKIQTRAPKLAQRLRMFMTTALIGTMIEPVMRNSSTSVAATTRRAANGRRSLSLALMSMSSAAMPPTSVSKVGCVPRSWATSSDASGPCEVPAGVTSTTVRPGGVSGRMEVPTTPGVVESCSNQAANSALSASVSAMTVTGSVPRAGNRSARVRATSRTSDERGRVRASPISKRAPRNGTPSRISTTTAAAPTARAWPCTHRVRR